MKSNSLSDIKKELKELDKNQLMELCLRLAKYKVDNKALLSYLLFQAGNIQQAVEEIKTSITTDFEEVPPLDKYYSKKSIRKVLRTTLKYAKYMQNKEAELELLIHFCKEFRNKGLTFSHQPIILNIYFAQIKKIEKLITGLHEDLQYDFQKEVDELMVL
jgi:hypothetical protein